jgi:hypothetical protein
LAVVALRVKRFASDGCHGILSVIYRNSRRFRELDIEFDMKLNSAADFVNLGKRSIFRADAIQRFIECSDISARLSAFITDNRVLCGNHNSLRFYA